MKMCPEIFVRTINSVTLVMFFKSIFINNTDCILSFRAPETFQLTFQISLFLHNIIKKKRKNQASLRVQLDRKISYRQTSKLFACVIYYRQKAKIQEYYVPKVNHLHTC